MDLEPRVLAVPAVEECCLVVDVDLGMGCCGSVGLGALHSAAHLGTYQIIKNQKLTHRKKV